MTHRGIRAKVVDVLLELAGCGLWDLKDLDLNEFVSPIAVQFNDIPLFNHENNGAMAIESDNDHHDQFEVEVESQGGISIPSWADIIKEPDKSIEVYAIFEIIIIHQKTYSNHKHIKDAELLM